MKNRQFKSVVRSDFKRNAKAIQRSDTMRIEYLVRQGQRRLEMMKVSVHVYAIKGLYEPFFFDSLDSNKIIIFYCRTLTFLASANL